MCAGSLSRAGPGRAGPGWTGLEEAPLILPHHTWEAELRPYSAANQSQCVPMKRHLGRLKLRRWSRLANDRKVAGSNPAPSSPVVSLGETLNSRCFVTDVSDARWWSEVLPCQWPHMELNTDTTGATESQLQCKSAFSIFNFKWDIPNEGFHLL